MLCLFIRLDLVLSSNYLSFSHIFIKELHFVNISKDASLSYHARMCVCFFFCQIYFPCSMYSLFSKTMFNFLFWLCLQQAECKINFSNVYFKGENFQVFLLSHFRKVCKHIIHRIPQMSCCFGLKAVLFHFFQPEFYQVCHTKADYDEHGPSICRHNPVFGTMS